MGEGVRQWTVSLLETETKKKAGLCLAYSTHATGFLVFLLLLQSLLLLLLLLLLHASRSIFEIDLFMFCNTFHLCFFLFFLLMCTVMACI
ncbi:hypothetical protein J1N35_045345 [Gossypium stocksii]|uniref:Uncharacterized protein n=1 Tax=Gossypium stocksii TaxID=47602 RepID=A0A9D3ZGW6_9ROSI|nr:hypothetical protein J1N35_045345 [Gossypium stocksii]